MAVATSQPLPSTYHSQLNCVKLTLMVQPHWKPQFLCYKSKPFFCSRNRDFNIKLDLITAPKWVKVLPSRLGPDPLVPASIRSPKNLDTSVRTSGQDIAYFLSTSHVKIRVGTTLWKIISRTREESWLLDHRVIRMGRYCSVFAVPLTLITDTKT